MRINSQLWRVSTMVMSEIHTRFGTPGAKSRCRKFGGPVVVVGVGVVVRLRRLLVIPVIW